MDNTLKFIRTRKDDYEYLKRLYEHDRITAKKLDFNTEVQKIENDTKWSMEIIKLLEEVEKFIQVDLNTK